jgi:hypothetical protein
MKQRTSAEIVNLLVGAGASQPLYPDFATDCSQAAAISDAAADAFVQQNRAKIGNLTPSQQKNLFQLLVPTYEQRAQSQLTNYATTNHVAPPVWASLALAIQEILFDLAFRGDLGASATALLFGSVASNNVAGFAALMKDRSNWPSVPKDRFDRRVAYLGGAQLSTADINSLQIPTMKFKVNDLMISGLSQGDLHPQDCGACTSCTGCTGCTGCTSCTGCTGCSWCTGATCVHTGTLQCGSPSTQRQFGGTDLDELRHHLSQALNAIPSTKEPVRDAIKDPTTLDELNVLEAQLSEALEAVRAKKKDLQ